MGSEMCIRDRKYCIRKEYTEVSRLDDKKEEPKIIVQPIQPGQQEPEEPPAGGEEPEPPQPDDKGQKGSGENAV